MQNEASKERLLQQPPEGLTSVDFSISGKILRAKAATTIYPGMLVKRIDGQYVTTHHNDNPSTAVLLAADHFDRDISEPYLAEMDVNLRYCLPGDVFWGLCDLLLPVEYGTRLLCRSNGMLWPADDHGSYDDRAIVGVSLGDVYTAPSDLSYIPVEVW